MKMVKLGDVLTLVRDPIHVVNPASEILISVRLHGNGAVRRSIADGKEPKPFLGNRGRSGQFVFSRIWARRGAMALIPPELDGVVVTSEFPIFAFNHAMLDSNYFIRYAVTQGFLARLERASAGASGQNRVKEGAFLNLRVPLPPLPEQRRIAAILDQADSIRSKRRSTLDRLNELRFAVFESRFSGFKPDATVEDVAVIQGGLQVSSKRATLPVEVRYLRVANAYRGRLDLTEVKLLRATQAEIDRTRLELDDLLFVEGHANPKEVGRVARWSGELPECVHQNHLIRARLSKEKVLPVFAEFWLNSDRGADHFRRAGKTTSGLNTISASTVRSAPIPIPPLALQQTFADRIAHLNTQRALVERALAADDELFASLQSRAFRGEL